MLKTRLPLFFICFLFCLSSCSFFNSDSIFESNDMISVSLIGDSHTYIASEDFIRLEKGEDAIFTVLFDDGYHLGSSSMECTINGSQIIFKKIQFSTTIYINSSPNGDFSLQIINDEEKGKIFIYPEKDQYDSGEDVTVTVRPYPGYEFMCFTFGHEYRNTDMYRPTGMPVSFKKQYTFKITQDTTLYTNFYDEDLLLMKYNANGGETIDGEESFSVDYEIVAPFVNPVTIVGSYYLFKPGATLISYNTKPDGSGVSVGIGSRVSIGLFNNGFIELYAIWSEWTDASEFDYTFSENGEISIASYKGDDSIVSIPDDIGGIPVTSILPNSFENKSLEKLILGKNIDVVEDYSFYNCVSCREIWIYTGIKQMSELSFVNCSLETVHINRMSIANNSTSNTSRDLTYQLDQIENMSGKRLIFYGLSTIRRNHDFSPFSAMYPDRSIYTFGGIWGCNYYLPLLILQSKMNYGDSIVVSLLEACLDPSASGIELLFSKYCLDELSHIDYSLMSSFLFSGLVNSFSAFSEGYYCEVFNSEKNGRCDSYGTILEGQVSDDINNCNPTTRYVFDIYMKDEWFDYLNKVFNLFNLSKDNIFITWSTYNENSVSDYEAFREYEDYVRKKLGNYAFFDSIYENIYPGNYFVVNDSLHLSTYGAKFRIERWIEELIL